MTIHDVKVNNWESPRWWKDVKVNPDEPLIEATFKMTLSWNEYHAMLTQVETSLVAHPPPSSPPPS